MPNLRAFEAGVSKGSAAAYHAWQQHHDGQFNEATGKWSEPCPTCFLLDWYDPGMPRPVPEADRDEYTHRVTAHDGTSYWYANNPDPAALCPTGRMLFVAWQHEAMHATERGR
jgi:hypothetical protein